MIIVNQLCYVEGVVELTEEHDLASGIHLHLCCGEDDLLNVQVTETVVLQPWEKELGRFEQDYLALFVIWVNKHDVDEYSAFSWRLRSDVLGQEHNLTAGLNMKRARIKSHLVEINVLHESKELLLLFLLSLGVAVLLRDTVDEGGSFAQCVLDDQLIHANVVSQDWELGLDLLNPGLSFKFKLVTVLAQLAVSKVMLCNLDILIILSDVHQEYLCHLGHWLVVITLISI
jgi:hypothetical protein